MLPYSSHLAMMTSSLRFCSYCPSFFAFALGVDLPGHAGGDIKRGVRVQYGRWRQTGAKVMRMVFERGRRVNLVDGVI